MSTITVEFRSKSLTRPCTFHLFYPDKDILPFVGDNPHYKRPAKTLFLLHGYTANSSEWIHFGRALELSTKYNLAIVVPDGGIHFYLDRPGTGNGYAKYIGEDLPQYLQDTFGLAKSKEDTFIMGDSMGGFGALHTALSYPDRFSCAMALSPALIVRQVSGMRREDGVNNGMADYDYYAETFGDPSKVLESKNNPETLIKNLKEEGKQLPRLFITCGTEDFLLEQNREFQKFLKEENIPVTYIEKSGMHNFDFWNTMTGPAIEFALSEEE